MSVDSVGTFSLSALPSASSKDVNTSLLKKMEVDTSAAKDSSAIPADKADAKLEKIKAEIKGSPILPSTEKIVAKYGITTDQAEKILSEVCMERATDAGGGPEQVTKTANDMYLIAELSDSEVFETIDIEKLLKGAEEQEKKDDAKALSANQIADKYDITLEQAQAVLDGIKKEEENSSDSSSATVEDLSAKPTYSIQCGSFGSTISLNNSCTLALSTVSYSA